MEKSDIFAIDLQIQHFSFDKQDFGYGPKKLYIPLHIYIQLCNDKLKITAVTLAFL